MYFTECYNYRELTDDFGNIVIYTFIDCGMLFVSTCYRPKHWK